MKKKEISNEYDATCNLLESLYLDSKNDEIIHIRDKYQDSFLFDESKEEYPQIIEIFSASYIELNMYSEALSLINRHIEFIKNRGYKDEDGMDDLTTFFQFKIIVYQKIKKKRKEYQTIKEYMSLGGTDQNIIENMSEIESIIFHRFYFVNKILIGLALLFNVLMYVLPSIFRNPYISIGTSLIIIWGLLIHVFHERTKQILVKLVLS
jgi:hypothetical protein